VESPFPKIKLPYLDLSPKSAASFIPKNELRDIVSRVLSVPSKKTSEIIETLQRLLSRPTRSKIKFSVFVRSMLATAIEAWCLQPFNINACWESVLAKANADEVKEMERQRISKVSTFINEGFKPAAGGRAEKLARVFHEQFESLLARDNTLASYASPASSKPVTMVIRDAPGALESPAINERFFNLR
jgi:hypothetical protein